MRERDEERGKDAGRMRDEERVAGGGWSPWRLASVLTGQKCVCRNHIGKSGQQRKFLCISTNSPSRHESRKRSAAYWHLLVHILVCVCVCVCECVYFQTRSMLLDHLNEDANTNNIVLTCYVMLCHVMLF